MTLAFLSPVSVAGTLTATDVLTVPQISASGSTGSSGQFLKSTGTGMQWVTISGTGTVTSVATGTGLTGGTITTSGTLAIDTTVVPQLAGTNTFTNTNVFSGTVKLGIVASNAGNATRLELNSASYSLGVYAANTNYVALAVKPFSSGQTSDLQQWQNSTSGVLSKVDVSGNITAPAHITTGGTSSQFVKGDGTLDSGTYLTTGAAASTYLTQSSATSTYLSQTTAASTYLSQTSATSTYLSQTSAASTYLAQTAASSTYLTQTAASTTYAPIQDITPFDDLRYQFDGIESRFVPTYQGTQVAITNPLRLLITVNGIVQSIDQSVVVWDSPLKPDGLRVDDDGYLAFSEVVPAGSSFSGRLMPGSSVTAVSTTYPFKAADLLIGAF